MTPLGSLARMLGAVVAVGLLAACQGASERTSGSAGNQPAQAGGGASAGSSGAAPAAPAGGAAPTPKHGGTLVLTLGADPAAIMPGITSGNTESSVGCVPYQGLTYPDKEYRPQPLLAESWQASDDNLIYTFRLRPGVKWHDGQPLTAADVKFSYEQVIARYHPRSQPLFSTIVQSVSTPDNQSVVVTLKEPYGPFLGQTDCFSAPVLPRHLYEGTDIPNNPHNTNPVGTGAFKFESWTPGDRVVFVRNEAYYLPNEPYLDRLVFRVIPDSAARTAALLAGEVDYLRNTDVSPPDYLRIKDDPRIQVGLNKTAPSDMMLTLNVQNPILSNKLVRHALYHAIDREAIHQQVFFGLGKVSKSMITTDIPWAYNPEVDLTRQYAYDPARANQLLDQAGYPRGADGNRMRPLRLLVETGRTGFTPTSQIVERNWAAVGVPVTLMPVERQVMIDTVYVRRDFDVNMNSLNTSGDPALGYARLYTCNNVRPVQFTNGTGYCNPEVDQLFERGATYAETSQRAPHYFQLQKILAEDLPILFLWQQGSTELASTKFELETTLWSGATIYDLWGKVYQK
jgi:peptide/nickel transport system substrate-binding protein